MNGLPSRTLDCDGADRNDRCRRRTCIAVYSSRDHCEVPSIASHTRAFFGCAAATLCDQLRRRVTTPCLHQPGVRRLHAEVAAHCGTTIPPVGRARPRDKAWVEGRGLPYAGGTASAASGSGRPASTL